MPIENAVNHSRPLILGMQFFADDVTPPAENSTPAVPAATEPAPTASQAPEGGAKADPAPAATQPAAPNATEPSKPAEPKKFTIKVNGATKEVTEDEAIALAQKGADYDRVRVGYDFAKEMAEKAGQADVSAFIESYRNTISEAEKAEIRKNHDDKVAQLEAMGYSHDLAEEQATALEEIAISKKEREAQKKNEQVQKLQEKEKAAQVQRMNALTAKYPEVAKDGKLNYPKEALELVGRFKDNDVLAGYEIYQMVQELDSTKKELAQLKAVNAADSANAQGSAASIGSVSGNAAVDKEVYTSEEWDRLPDAKKDQLIRSGAWAKSAKLWNKK